MHDVAESLFDLLDDYEQRFIKKGAILYNILNSQMAMLTNDGETFTIRVPKESSNLTYTVTLDTIEQFDDCICPTYEDRYHCKHVAAALFFVFIQRLGYIADALGDKYNLKLIGAEKDDKAAKKAKVGDTQPATPQGKPLLHSPNIYYHRSSSYRITSMPIIC